MDKTIDFPKKKELIEELRKNNIIFAAFFGSRAKGTANPDSDYDIIVEFDPRKSIPYSKFYDAKMATKKLLNSELDFLTVKSISKFMRDEILKTMKVIYDDRSRKG